MIYFIQDESTLYIKIGYTAGDPAERLAALQVGCPGGLVLIHVIPGDQQEESRLHRLFSDSRARGEWFRPTPHLLCWLIDANRADGWKLGYDAGLREKEIIDGVMTREARP